MTTLGGLYREILTDFRAASLATPELDARWLVAEAAGLPATAITLSPDSPITAETAAKAHSFRARRLSGEPVDRILGHRAFWSLEFRLGPATLSPRPDTETIVETCLALLPEREAAYRLLDLGTGTGAILIALLHERPEASGIGIDRAADALTVATLNAADNGVAERAQFRLGNWMEGLEDEFDLIVSNPPYIPSADIGGLEREVREHDPRLALDGGTDGLDAYRAIAADAPRLLRPGGLLVFELGIDQEEAVATLMRRAGFEMIGPARKDLGGIARALAGRSTGKPQPV
ncbi:peptide chain release factor N(5)-glutamine methyltransferase [Labrys sp. KNU-23]|uniref:peptide chain release factor N(5)-glutamine methyltransferase n=1 Tax=Labrys sp. KNU-23 TaxID=2789216 RepID=UPI0011EC4EFF|nr:peptide chain release factor N(5)-glutamine methyltransferase [Labrys sp. KNU-23]QEN87972.1 peptide chain release factor N(5)-glutamine methyltransferase [Labrys sp. KNU-23]